MTDDRRLREDTALTVTSVHFPTDAVWFCQSLGRSVIMQMGPFKYYCIIDCEFLGTLPREVTFRRRIAGHI